MNNISLIKYEEGWRPKPYLCSEGYPTAGFGFKLGPKNAPLSYYTFTLPLSAGEAWLTSLLPRRTAGDPEESGLSVRRRRQECRNWRHYRR